MKLLYIDTYIPYPLNSGGSQAFFTITDYIRKQHDLSLLLYVHNSTEKKYVEELMKIWDNVTFYIYELKKQKQQEQEPTLQELPYNNMSWTDKKSCQFFEYIYHSMQRKIARRKRKYDVIIPAAPKEEDQTPSVIQSDLVRNNSTLFMGTGDLSPSFCQFVKDVSSKGFDIIQVEFYDYLPLVYLLPEETKKVFVHHEIRFVRNEIEYCLFQNPLSTDKLLLEKEKAQELASLSAFDAIVTLTDVDKDILSKYIPSEKIFSSPAITQTVTLEHKKFTPAKELIFVGSGYHFPNADAMVWFCKEVVPIMQRKGFTIPSISITGKWSNELIYGIKKICPNINFVNYVDDLQSFLNGKISIVPIRIGSGMRMKILDSIFAAAPVITTSKGCEGLPMVSGDNCLIADTAEDFANAIMKLVPDQQLQEQLATNAQSTKTGMLNDKELFNKRLSVYKTLLGI